MLLETHSGKIQCAYLDPPYNTKRKSVYTYKDSKDSCEWLEDILQRIEIVRELLCENGTLWISIDNNECHYLKVAVDDIFDKHNFVSEIVWERRTQVENTCKFISNVCEKILVYSKKKKSDQGDMWKLDREIYIDEKIYKYTDDNGAFQLVSLTSRDGSDYEITTPSGRVIKLSKRMKWRVNEEDFHRLVKKGIIFFPRNGGGIPRRKVYLNETIQHNVCKNLWKIDEVGGSRKAVEHQKRLFGDDWFETAKPEQLMQRILKLATKEGDIVLDAYAGSGTMGAAAHKMRRRYIMIEQSDSFFTHVKPRIEKVIAGEDWGISKDVGWTGGGEFCVVSLIISSAS